MSGRADLLIVAQQAMNTHHRTAAGTCAECKTSDTTPCPIWTLAVQVIALVNHSIRNYPAAGRTHTDTRADAGTGGAARDAAGARVGAAVAAAGGVGGGSRVCLPGQGPARSVVPLPRRVPNPASQ